MSPFSIIKPFAQTGIASKIGLHPALTTLSQSAGTNLAIMQKYGITSDPGRSHDTCQLLYSVGANGGGNTNQQGFLARLMDLQHWDSFQVWGIQAESGPDFDTTLNPPMLVSSLDSLSTSLTYAESADDQALIESVTDSLIGVDTDPRKLPGAYQATNKILQNTLKGVKRDILSQTVGSNRFGNYSEDDIGPALKDTARILLAKAKNGGSMKSDTSTVIYLNQGSYDTHSNQVSADGGLSGLLSNLGNNLAVFIEDLRTSGVWNSTAVVVFSEFGRTVHENGRSGDQTVGTDHGWGSNTVVLGGSIQGGVFGETPSLTELSDEDTNALVPTLDYRDIFSDTLEWLGVEPKSIFTSTEYQRRRLGLYI